MDAEDFPTPDVPVDTVAPEALRDRIDNGEDVFLMDPTDTTTWLGPKQLYGSDEICMFRLLEVIPERNATFEEVEDQLRIMTRNRLEEQATVEYMRRLEERYGLVINDEILRQLPEDPGLWSTL